VDEFVMETSMSDLSPALQPGLPDTDVGAMLEEFAAAPRHADDGLLTGLEAVFDVPVKVQAVLGRSRMPIGDLLRLKAGMVMELDRRVGEPVDIFVNDRLIARGEVVMIDDSLGVTLTEIVQQER
jgi:flagellar motor switch protein FliN/FliY